MQEFFVRVCVRNSKMPANIDSELAIDTPPAGVQWRPLRASGSVHHRAKATASRCRQAGARLNLQPRPGSVYAGNECLVRNPKAPHVDREGRTVRFGPKVVKSFDDDVLSRAVKIVGVSDDLERVRQCEAYVQKALGSRATAARSQPYYLDVTNRDANKGFVLDYLSRELSVSPSEIATIGDQPNDVLMFRRSGLSIAMGNASDDVKRQATAVTDSYDDEGFAKAVERFVL
jgi:hydroxymethylpyrimidine pyrophosphatase-like HAD family hydrolase